MTDSTPATAAVPVCGITTPHNHSSFDDPIDCAWRDRQPTTAAEQLTVSVTKIAGVLPVNVRDGVMLCPQCGDELVEVSRDVKGVTYECRTDKAVMDVVRRELRAEFDPR